MRHKIRIFSEIISILGKLARNDRLRSLPKLEEEKRKEKEGRKEGRKRDGQITKLQFYRNFSSSFLLAIVRVLRMDNVHSRSNKTNSEISNENIEIF